MTQEEIIIDDGRKTQEELTAQEDTIDGKLTNQT